MRIKRAIFIGSMATLASLTAPALARNSDAGNSDAKATSEQPAASSCSAQQRMPDGTWAQLPCRELGSPEQAPHKSAARGPEEPTR